MPLINFLNSLDSETQRLAGLGIAKFPETVIEKFTFSQTKSPQAVISNHKFSVFNSNDYLGLRFHPKLIQAEHQASAKYGVGPGAVRFISGSLLIHQQLEQALADFHHRQDAIVFSSAFAANFSAISALSKGQSQDSLVSSDTLIISDQLNHRSIVDGIRVTTLPSENRLIYRHLDFDHLIEILTQNIGKFSRCLVISDGVFSMLGEIVDLKRLRGLCDQFDSQYPQGVLLYIDDAHGVGVIGDTGRGTEEYCASQADVLVGTLGKAFGCDGGYIVGSKEVITYLRESASGYIYSNNLSPGTASAALASVNLVASKTGQKLISLLRQNMQYFHSSHAIYPLILGDPQKTLTLKKQLFADGFLVTAINYPVVPKGRDEIRIQVSASHTASEIKSLLTLIHGFYPGLLNSFSN